MMPRVVVDNTIEMTEEKVSDVFLVTKEFHTSTEFSQFIEKSAFNAQTPCMDMVVDYCIKKEIEIESISKLFSYGAALNKFGINTMLKRIGSGGSQLPFNSILGVLFSDSHTISPFINAGAIATTSCHYVPTYNEATAKGPCRYDKNYNF